MLNRDTHLTDEQMNELCHVDVCRFADFVAVLENEYLNKGDGSGMTFYEYVEEMSSHMATEEDFKHYTINEFNTKAEDCNAPLCMRIAPPVEEWLNGLYNSDFVVTDSFHGCVFSILFNKPFIVYGNRQRGLDRFTSILDFLDLSDTLICSEGDFNKKLIEKSFNWIEINNKLESQRKEIVKRLKTVLSN